MAKTRADAPLDPSAIRESEAGSALGLGAVDGGLTASGGACNLCSVSEAAQQPWTDNRQAFLDLAYEELSSPGADVPSVMDRLSDGLWWFRKTNSSEWQSWSADAVLHPIARLIHQDPFTSRSFAKPRGYAGDAPLLDLIYYDQGFGVPRDVSGLGSRIYWRNRNAPAPVAVRERRDHLATFIDRTAMRVQRPEVLAIACGHLREGLKSVALFSNQLSRLVALDQDEESLNQVKAAFGRLVETRLGNVRYLLASDRTPERFDCIYAAGLYDYLETRLAIRLTAALFQLLKPGGELVIANFVPDVLDAGYMETYMGWRLLYRTPDELLQLACELPLSARLQAKVYFLGAPDVCYLAVRND